MSEQAENDAASVPDTSHAKPKRERRRFSFSLRTLMIVVLLVGVVLAPLVRKWHRYQEQQAVVDWIGSSGGWVSYRYDYGSWWQHVFGDDLFDAIDKVKITNGDVKSVARLAGLKELQTLTLSYSQVSDLGPLAGLKELQTLGLRGTPVSDLAPLAGLKKLRELGLRDTPVSDLAPLAALKELQYLDLRYTQVSDLSPLAGLKNVTIFLRHGQKVTVPKELEGRVKR